MNERIKELLLQNRNSFTNGVTDTIGGVYIHGSQENLEKFAELIVRKCIEQASIGNGHGNNQWDRALTFAGKNIKEHFGVEE